MEGKYRRTLYQGSDIRECRKTGYEDSMGSFPSDSLVERGVLPRAFEIGEIGSGYGRHKHIDCQAQTAQEWWPAHQEKRHA